MPTFVEIAGATYPAEYRGKAIQPMEGMSLTPCFTEREPVARTLYWEHEGNRAVRDGKWKLVGLRNQAWELYNVAEDRTELQNLAEQRRDKFEELKAKWQAWAENVGVLMPEEFRRARRAARSR
jgi:arylsulfatase